MIEHEEPTENVAEQLEKRIANADGLREAWDSLEWWQQELLPVLLFGQKIGAADAAAVDRLVEEWLDEGE